MVLLGYFWSWFNLGFNGLFLVTGGLTWFNLVFTGLSSVSLELTGLAVKLGHKINDIAFNGFARFININSSNSPAQNLN